MASEIEVPAPTIYRDVSISDVEGYLEARLVLVRLSDWVESAPAGTAKDAARTLIRIVASSKLSRFTTSTQSGRANILGLFATLVSATNGIVTQQHYDDLAAMTVAPPGDPSIHPPRWLRVIEGIPGAPNAPTEDLIAEAMA